MIPVAHELPEELDLPDTLSVSFEGFSQESFDLLKAIKQAPHIETYRALKKEIGTSIAEPFKRFRDDLVVNWVLPNRLPFETERNVFSRLLKNDFGAGGCHHHQWMSFYRTGMRRLSDVQLAHTIRENGFSSSLYIGDNAPGAFKQAKKHIIDEPAVFLDLVNTLLENEKWSLRMRPHKASRGDYLTFMGKLAELPSGIEKAKGIWWHTFYPEDTIFNQGRRVVRSSLDAVKALWPLYLFLLGERK